VPHSTKELGSGAGIRSIVKVPSICRPAKLIVIDDPLNVMSEAVSPTVLFAIVKPINGTPLENVSPEKVHEFGLNELLKTPESELPV